MRHALGISSYLALYVALDWVSLIHPFGALAISPWNPPAGLTFALFLREGYRFAPVAFAAVVLADFVLRDLAAAPGATLAAAAAIALGYAAAADLLRTRLGLSLRLERERDVLCLLGAALVVPVVIAPAVVALFRLAGLVEPDEFLDATLHFWVGDVLGIAVLTPFLLLVFERRLAPRWPGRRAAVHAAQLATIGAALLVVFAGGSTDHFEFSYVLLLPLIWIGLSGLPAASAGIVVTQLGLVGAIQLKGGYESGTVAQFQLLLLAVAVAGLLLGTVVDGRRRAERLLRDSEARLKAVVETAPDAILTFSEAGALLSSNPAGERMFRLDAGPSGRATRQRLLPELAPGAASRDESTAHRLDGTPFLAEVAAARASVGDQRLDVAVVRDITARKAAEQRLKLREQELARAGRAAATGELAASLAHELNQPLTALIGFARACQALLQSPTADRETLRRSGEDLIDAAVQQAIRAGDIIRTTREFLAEGDARPARLDLGEVAAAVRDLLGAEFAHAGVQLTMRVPERLPPVLADRIQLEQVLVNLIRNSIEALRRAEAGRKEIVVQARLAESDQGFVEVAIVDTGPGFPAELADRLFTRFSSTKEGGMGLGLSISRSIIEAHGGRIWAPSAEIGAEIRFTLPVYPSADDDA